MSPWKVLGLAPTDDARAIRRAYAARLKALDPDDRDGFVALRDALDAANDWWWDEEADHEDEVEGLEVDLPVMILPVADTPLARSDGVTPVDAPAWHVEADAIEALVRDAPAEPEAVARVERLLAAPEMEQVGTAQAVEDWLAWLVAESMPRADALIAPAARRFGWAAQAKGWDCPWAIRRAIQRRDDLAWLKSQSGYTVHGFAWQLLTDPTRAPYAKGAGLVETMLHEIDARRLTLRADLDEAVVARWETFLAQHRDRPVARFGRRAMAMSLRVATAIGKLIFVVLTGLLAAGLGVGLLAMLGWDREALRLSIIGAGPVVVAVIMIKWLIAARRE